MPPALSAMEIKRPDIGDKLTLVHPCGERREVFLADVNEKKMRARVIYPMAGGYDVDLTTGYVKDKKARLWRLTEQSLKLVLSIIAKKSLEKSERSRST